MLIILKLLFQQQQCRLQNVGNKKERGLSNTTQSPFLYL